MSHLLLFTFSFKRVISTLLAPFLLVACTEAVTVSGKSDLASSGCAGDGGFFPSPTGPQSLIPNTKTKEWQKFEISDSVFKTSGISFSSQPIKTLKAGSELVAIVNEVCVQSFSRTKDFLSQQLRDQVDQQKSTTEFRAYTLKTATDYSFNQLKSLAFEDPCLIHLSENSVAQRSATVNDPQFSSQTHLTAIKAPTAWDTFHTGLTGDTIIAIIDDGMQMDHPDLSGVLWVNPGEIAGNSIDDDGNGYVDDINGYNFASNIASPAQQNGSTHGTHVAGLAAAQGNNGIGVSGVMGRNAKIMALNVFGTNSGAGGAAIVNAINYAAAKGAHVINMSLGGSGTSAATNTAMVNAVAAGSFIAIAAGNDNQLVTSSAFVQPMGYAKDIEGAMAVGSLDATTLEKSDFSNYSTSYVEIAAPGSNSATGGVLATYPTSTYNYLQGTSMASPVTAGVAALLIGWVRSRDKTITPAQVESILKSSADSKSSLSTYFMGGASVNMVNLVGSALCSY